MSNLLCQKRNHPPHHQGCNGLSPTIYLEYHGNVCKYIYVLLLLEHGFIEKYIPCYQHQTAQIAENNSTKILWNFLSQTDHQVINNKPDSIAVDKIIKTANLIEVAVPNDYNICNKRLQKMRAYANASTCLVKLRHSGIWINCKQFWSLLALWERSTKNLIMTSQNLV